LLKFLFELFVQTIDPYIIKYKNIFLQKYLQVQSVPLLFLAVKIPTSFCPGQKSSNSIQQKCIELLHTFFSSNGSNQLCNIGVISKIHNLPKIMQRRQNFSHKNLSTLLQNITAICASTNGPRMNLTANKRVFKLRH
jgi:hypothetical protein